MGLSSLVWFSALVSLDMHFVKVFVPATCNIHTYCFVKQVNISRIETLSGRHLAMKSLHW